MKWIIAVYTLAVLYSFVRYVLFAPANWEHLPIFVTNKGISMAAAICFSIAFWRQWRHQKNFIVVSDAPMWFRAGVFGSLAHIPMSLAILRPSYFKEFFTGERLSFNGEAVFMLGALTAAGVYLLTRTTWTTMHRWLLSLATMLLLFSHTLAMGIARGLNINKSHAYLPPMWLLSLIGISLGLVFLALSKPKQSASEAEASYV